MTQTSRRDFLISTAAGTAALMAGGIEAGQTKEPTGDKPMDAPAPSFAASLVPKPLSFDPAKLKGLSEKLIRSHWENNYSGSVKTLNGVKQRLAAALSDKDTPAFVYGDLKREHLMRTGSVVLHELYFENLGGDGKADASIRAALGTAMGSFDTWETEFRKIAASLGGGSGWVVTAKSAHTGLIETFWMADHLHFPAGYTPLLVMDMYEHSYALDYGAAAAKYIDAFFQNIRWDAVSARMTPGAATT